MRADTRNLPIRRSGPDDAAHQSEQEGQGDLVVKEEKRIQRPRRYKVLVHNDDYTTMEFVVLILKNYFAKSPEEASRVMLNIHQTGTGIAGIYTYEVAESKCHKVTLLSRQKGYPLKCTIERE